MQLTADNSASNSGERRASGSPPRDSLPVLLTVDEAAALLRTTPRGDLRDDRPPTTAWRHTDPQTRPRPRDDLLQTLAGPEARAIATGVSDGMKIRPYRRGGWEVDIRVPLARGGDYRERKRLTVTSRSAARRWGEDRERVLLVDGHARANQHKPGGILHTQTLLRLYLIPQLGAKSLDAIATEDVQQLKRHLSNQTAKSVNNVLTILNTLLKKAVEWGVSTSMPMHHPVAHDDSRGIRFL